MRLIKLSEWVLGLGCWLYLHLFGEDNVLLKLLRVFYLALHFATGQHTGLALALALALLLELCEQGLLLLLVLLLLLLLLLLLPILLIQHLLNLLLFDSLVPLKL